MDFILLAVSERVKLTNGVDIDYNLSKSQVIKRRRCFKQSQKGCK